MKKLLFLLLFPLALHAQTRIVGMGEYQSFVLNKADHQVYTMRTGVQVKVPGQPANIVNVFGGLHVHYLLDAGTNLWAYDENAVTFTLVDSKVVKAAPCVNGVGTAVIHTDGTLWVQGVQQKFPAGTVITDVWYPNAVFALDSAGGVWSGNYSSPTVLMQGTNLPVTNGMAKVPLPGPAKAIAAHPWAAHFVLRNGQVYAGGSDIRYYGFTLFGLNSVPVAPIRVDQLHKFPAPIAQISADYMTTYAILTDGSMWAWGENTSGTVGNGQETNMLATTPNTYSAPWFNSPEWNRPTSQGGALFQQLATQIGMGTQWAYVNRGTCFAMYGMAEDVNGHLYSWGRWKGLVLWNGVTGTSAQYNNQENQPNLFDVLVPTPIKDLPNVAPPPPANIPPVASLVAPASLTMPSDTIFLDGSGSSDPDGLIASYSFQQVSGPPAVLVQSGTRATVYPTAAGTFAFRLTVVDNGGLNTSTTASVVINPYPPCPVCQICPPQRSVTAVSATINGVIYPLPLPWLTITY